MDSGAPKLTLVRTSQGKIIGHHPKVREVLDTIGRVAASPCTVLIYGENGTGKELVVAALHDASPRAQQPFIAVNCGSIPENLIESELFGHTRGAFTDAHATRKGHVASAEGGTLFFDEVGELPLSAQVKLLRLLQQREYTPVGASSPVKCDVRVVAATNRDLGRMVKEKTFREDLYYRLNVVQVQLPPLRERGSDVESLALYFLQHHAARANREGLTGYEPGAMEALRAWRWPGNIRELENAVERAVLLSKGPLIAVTDLTVAVRENYDALLEMQTAASTAGVAQDADETIPWLDPNHFPEEGVDIHSATKLYQAALIRRALLRSGNVRSQAARLLGVQRTTLVEMIRRLNL